MPTTVTITAYQFQELSDKAKSKVMDKLYPDGDWYDFIIENAKTDGEALGFDIEDIRFCGFHSQGDGASWTGYIRIIPWLELNKPNDPLAHILIALSENDWVENKIAVSSSGRYNHSHTMLRSDWYGSFDRFDGGDVIDHGIFKGASLETLADALPASYMDDIADEMLASARDFADKIYKQLRDEWGYQCSEEYITEMCEANEYLFTEHGQFI